MSMTIDEMIAVLQAAKELKQIQWRRDNREWHDCACNPPWDFETYDYRVKPEPREWVIQLTDVPDYSKSVGYAFPDSIGLLPMKDSWIRVREVIEEGQP